MFPCSRNALCNSSRLPLAWKPRRLRNGPETYVQKHILGTLNGFWESRESVPSAKTLFCALSFTNPLKNKMDKMTDPACAGLQYYTYAEHKFRFAAWAAGNAAVRGLSLGPAKTKLKLKDNEGVTFAVAYRMLNKSDLYGIAKKGAGCLPDPKNFDNKHCDWCKKVHEEAKRLGIKTEPDSENDDKYWSYGRSAKLINVFLKTLAPLNLENLPYWEAKKWLAVHPPIDGNVLKGMKDAGIGNTPFEGHKTVWAWLRAETDSSSSRPYGSWTKFKCKHYKKVIDLIRKNLCKCGETDPLPLWKNERFFNPNR